MISAVVLTKNEERNIKDCLESLQWCGEIVIIDDYSNDKTVEIAKKFGARIYQRHLNGDFATQRNFGLEKTKGEWILFVDADERVSKKLRDEILRLVSSQNSAIAKKCDGYYLKRKDYFGGRWLKHGETANVKLLRLARKNASKWVRKVHETWSVKKRVGKLNNPLLHYPHPTISDFLEQVNFYSTLHAKALHKERVRPSLFGVIAYPLGKFWKNYFFRLGFLDGMPGLIVALMMSFHSFLARGKLYRLLASNSFPSSHHPRRSIRQAQDHLGGGTFMNHQSTRRRLLEKIIAILLFCYFVLFPFGQLGRVPVSAVGELIVFSPHRGSVCTHPRCVFGLLGHPGGVLEHFANLGGFFGPEVHLYLTDVILFLLLLLWGIWRFLMVKRKYRLPSLALPIFSFSVISLLSLGLASPLLSNREVLIAGLYWLRWMVYAGLYFVLIDLKSQFKWLKRENLPQHQPRRDVGTVRDFASDTREKSRALARGGSLNFLIGVGVMIALFGLAQYFLWPNLRPLEELEWDPHYYRVVGTFLDPGFTGIILALTMILIVDLFSPPPRMVFTNLGGVFGLFSGLTAYLALALTYSRASYLAYIVGIAVVAWLRKMPKLFWGALLLGILTLIILPRPAGEGGKLGRAYSIEARIKNWQHSLVIARDHPALGVGFNAYRYAQRDYGFLNEEEWPVSHSGAGADSSLLFVLATTGIFGLLSYLWIWGKVVTPPPRRTTRSSFRLFGSQKPLIWLYSKLRIQGLKACHLAGVLRQNRRNRGDRSVILASLAAVFAHSLFLNSLFYPWVMAWIWVLLATESS